MSALRGYRREPEPGAWPEGLTGKPVWQAQAPAARGESHRPRGQPGRFDRGGANPRSECEPEPSANQPRHCATIRKGAGDAKGRRVEQANGK